MDAVEKDLCEAYRKGCQETILARMGTLSERVDSHSLALVALSTKVDLLKVNEVAHLRQELEAVKKMRREPLGRKEWAAVASTFIIALSSIVVALISR